MSSASHREDPGSNPGKGRFFRIKMKNVTFELLRCSYSHIWWIYEPSIGMVYEPLIGSGCRAETGIIVPTMETYHTHVFTGYWILEIRNWKLVN